MAESEAQHVHVKKLHTRRKAGKLENQRLLNGLEVSLHYTYTEPAFQIMILLIYHKGFTQKWTQISLHTGMVTMNYEHSN